MDFSEEGYYEFKCKCGHVSKFYHPLPRHELLLQIAMLAFVDGHYKETVQSCSSALERFYEFYLRFLAFRAKITSADFEVTWKTLQNQSERQFGAYVFAYLQENRKPFPKLPDRHVQLRNKVAHKGHLPTQGEAAEFAQRSINYIKDRIKEMVADGNADLHAFTLSCIAELKRKYPDANSVATWTILSDALGTPLGEEFALADSIRILKQFRNQW